MSTEDILASIDSEVRNFFTVAKEAREFNATTKKIIEAESAKPIDEVAIKRGEDWSALSNQVVGCENL